MRKLPESEPPAQLDMLTHKQLGLIVQTREYQVITPIFGGGVVPGEIDPLTPVRGSEIRGHLRFWWRATRGSAFGDNLEAMKAREDKIWGKAYKKDDKAGYTEGTVQIKVKQPEKIKPVLPFTVVKAMKNGQPAKNRDGSQKYQSRATHAAGVHPYAAFPLQPTQDELNAFSRERELERLPQQKLEEALFSRLKKVYQSSHFQLTLTFEEQYRKEIEAALWAWETFGGLGARTRRGFGSLRCVSIIEDAQEQPIDLPGTEHKDILSWLDKMLIRHIPVINKQSKHTPHLLMGTHFALMESHKIHDPLTIWDSLVERLHQFRQMRSGSDTRHPGRSYWPEPSAIRKRTEQSLPAHKNPIPNPRIDKFPRAAFGLPIIFQFKDSSKSRPDDTYSDPRKTVLQLIDSERLASPLILKVLACQNDAYVGLALILDGTGVEGKKLLLKSQEGKKTVWDEDVEARLTEDEAFTIANQRSAPPIRIDEIMDALRAFLNYL